MNKYTGFISRLNAWILHKSSDRYNQLVNDRKKNLLTGVTGRVLEIGLGTGANLEYYPETITLIGLEPSPHMEDYLIEKPGNRKTDRHSDKTECKSGISISSLKNRENRDSCG